MANPDTRRRLAPSSDLDELPNRAAADAVTASDLEAELMSDLQALAAALGRGGDSRPSSLARGKAAPQGNGDRRG